MPRFCVVAATLSALLMALPADRASAGPEDKYPSRSVKIIMSLPPGSSPDIRTRIIAAHLTGKWGQQVVVENRPGGGGAVAVRAALSPAADGHTLLSTVASVFTILPAQQKKLPFDVNRDLIPLALLASEPMVLAVSSKLGVNTLAELIARANADPHKLVIGTNPAGSLPHLAAVLLVSLSKAPMTVVPYSRGGTAEAVSEILGGRVHAVIESRVALKGTLDSGDLKAVAIMAPERVPYLPQVPAAAETLPGLVALGWNGLFAVKGTPDAVVRQLGDNLRDTLAAPEVLASSRAIRNAGGRS